MKLTTRHFFRSLLSLTVIAFLFTGCGRVGLHHELEEGEAEEILVVLQQNGIDAKKEKEEGDKVAWTVTVTEGQLAQARQILIANNLPKKRAPGLKEVYQETRTIPTPDEQKAQYLLSLKGEIINILHRLPGVIEADVVLNVPNDDRYTMLDPTKKRTTASVLIKTDNDPSVAQTVTEAEVQRFVARSVPNLDPNDVAVIISRVNVGSQKGNIGVAAVSPVSPPLPGVSPAPTVSSETSGDLVKIAGLKMAVESVKKFKLYMLGLLISLMAVSGYLLYTIFRLNRMRLKVQKGTREPKAVLGAPPSTGLLSDAQATAGSIDGTFNVGAPSQKAF